MISKFEMKNLTNGKEVSLGQDSSSQYVYKDDGLDWGSAPATHNTYTYPGQIGTYISTTSVRERTISITGYVYYIPNEQEKQLYFGKDMIEYCYEKILEKKKILNEIVNPTQYVRLTIGNYYIDGKPNSSVMYGRNHAENNEYFCKFLITLYCNNPMFRKKIPSKTSLSSTAPKFHFPLVFPKNRGIVMGIRTNYQILGVENEGDSPIGCIVTIKAKGTITNPTIEVIDKDQRMTVYKTLQEDETIIINTIQGERSVKGILNGVEEDYFKYWDYENTWIELPIGTTLIGYSLESGDKTLVDVTVDIIPMKYGLEEM